MQNGTDVSIDTSIDTLIDISIDTVTFYLNLGLATLSFVELIFFVAFVVVTSIVKAKSTQNDTSKPPVSVRKLIINKFNVILVVMLMVVTFQPALLASALTYAHLFRSAPKWHTILNIFGNATIEIAYIFYSWIRSKAIPGLKNTTLYSILSVFVKYCPILLYSQLVFAVLPDSPVVIKCQRWSLLFSAFITAVFDLTFLCIFVKYLCTESSDAPVLDQKKSIVSGNAAVELNVRKFRVTARYGIFTSTWALLCVLLDLVAVSWDTEWVNFIIWLAWLCLHNAQLCSFDESADRGFR
ncbi:hypothetical protein BCR33DRAFT_236111 [Rhizoclosmatium globosum]|uniref:Uncharacterized protein n=1 Tax=Rhizoclosmatium globosum TaxID=329046 RepID=A0A1Y2CAS0_9FUNG|nr:hypothetical protein BCR33DRAFT_236111 [Rhizoclosmatium globosum]|eukprot:ORY44138.1 hypothetical protein BCR33DRAFT_236111 [Rhizoclosmatium globosum]